MNKMNCRLKSLNHSACTYNYRGDNRVCIMCPWKETVYETLQIKKIIKADKKLKASLIAEMYET